MLCWVAAKFWAGMLWIWHVTAPNLMEGLAKILAIAGILLLGTVLIGATRGMIFLTGKGLWIFISSLLQYKRRQALQQSHTGERDDEEE